MKLSLKHNSFFWVPKKRTACSLWLQRTKQLSFVTKRNKSSGVALECGARLAQSSQGICGTRAKALKHPRFARSLSLAILRLLQIPQTPAPANQSAYEYMRRLIQNNRGERGELYNVLYKFWCGTLNIRPGPSSFCTTFAANSSKDILSLLAKERVTLSL